MWELLGVSIAFILVILLIRKKYNFGLSLLLGAAVLSFITIVSGISSAQEVVEGWIGAIFYSFDGSGIHYDVMILALLMTCIYILARCMQKTGAIGRLIKSLQTIFVHGGTLAVVPAIYGLMPVPGGAMFSAPVVAEEGDRFGLGKVEKNFLNVWFRHIWFSIYPLSSAMILICSDAFSDINIYTLMIVDMPAFLVSLLLGAWFLHHCLRKRPKEKKTKKDLSGLIFLIPPLLPIGIYALLNMIGVDQMMSFLIGVCLSIAVLFLLVDLPLRNYLLIVKNALTWKLAAAILGIVVFREMFSLSGATISIANIIGGLPVSSVVIIVAIPLILGVLTGYNLGAMTLSYPLVEPFFAASGLSIVGVTSIIFVSSVAGYLVSPIHLCNVVSSEYLKTDLTKMYPFYLPFVAAMLILQVVSVIALGL